MPLPTLGCTIDATGIRAPSYAAVFASLQESARTIFGADVYLEPDSQDGQYLGITAQAITDTNNATIAAYNAYSPAYAQGAGLASVVKINGLTVPAATNSTVVVRLSGTVGATITSGIVQDTSGNLWNLPGTVTISPTGSVDATAVAQQPGAVQATVGTVIGIYTPTFGWQSVTNLVAAAPGAPVMTDAQIRRAQRTAVALPSQSIDAGILAGVRNSPGVSLAELYENDTNATDANGLPPHSIALVVQGGVVQEVVNAIGVRKTPGTSTVGSIVGTYTDPVVGLQNLIRYYPLTLVPLRLDIAISPLPGFTFATLALITNALVAYVNGLAIGTDAYLSKLYGPANLYGDAATTTSGMTQAQLDVLSNTYNISSFAIGPIGGPTTPANYPIPFTSAASLQAINVIITVV